MEENLKTQQENSELNSFAWFVIFAPVLFLAGVSDKIRALHFLKTHP